MEISIDFNKLEFLLGMNPIELFWYLFSHGGWLILVIIILHILFQNRLANKQDKYLKSVKQVFLAIDVPKDNEQSMVAVEQIFAALSGIATYKTLYEKYWLGQQQFYLSLEIISLEGYIQFLIRTPEKFRDLVESAIYAQYPEAEITEVGDYTSLIPDNVHKKDSEYTFWGVEYFLIKHSIYPIKTFRSFEHPLSQSFVDPMASMLEVMSKIGKGEQIALQLVISPTYAEGWKKEGYKIIRKLIGEKKESPKHLGDKLVDASVKGLENFSEGVLKLWGDIKEQHKRDEPPNLMLYLTPDERHILESIQIKLGQTCFATRFRLYYLAHKETFLKARGVNAIVGAINQFNTHNLNALLRHPLTQTDNVHYLFTKTREAMRQKRVIKNFKERRFYHGHAIVRGPRLFMLSKEELATLYHFPTITVKAPLIKKTEVKKAEPPTTLPIKIPAESGFFKPATTEEAEKETVITPEPEAEKKYVIAESLPGYDFDNDYYEERFAKNKTSIESKSDSQELTKEKEAPPPTNLPISLK
ncbi:hypothetical protein KKF32_03150 [Patescibacteria group bacterium]|nr:hypothetical protein [Patescibacteria group bacterium]